MNHFCDAYLLHRRGDGHTPAVSMVQSCFNQHGVRPQARRLARLVESALESGDVYEARRAALVLAQLYPEAESWPVWARAFAEE